MKRFLPILFLLTSFLCAQETTYSPYEERMGMYLNNQTVYAIKYDSLQLVRTALDSCRNFLKAYPRTFIKAGALSYMVTMAAQVTKDPQQITPLVDSLLACDQSAVTKYGVALTLAEKEIAPELCYRLLEEAYPELTDSYHRYRSNILFARREIARGHRDAAKGYFLRALQFDSTRAEGWQEYAAFLKFSEDPSGFRQVMTKIQDLDRRKLLSYLNRADHDPNLNKSILDHTWTDLEGKPFDLRSQLTGPVILQDFNFWCPNKKEQLKLLANVERKFPKVKVLLLNVGETPHELKTRYLNKRDYRFYAKHPILYSDSLFWNRIYGHTATSLMVIDTNGVIRAGYQGYSPLLDSLLMNTVSRLSK